jgi:hypothetical protein
MLPTMMQNYSTAFTGGRYQYMAEHLPEYGDFTVEEIRTLRIRHWHKFGTTFDLKNMGWNPANMNAEGARKMGRQIEANFLKWLKKKERTAKWDRGAAGVEKYDKLREKYGKDKSIRELNVLDIAAKHAKFTEEQKAKKGTKDFVGTLDMDAAKKWAAEKGGNFQEYVGKTYDQAKKIAVNYADEISNKTQLIVGMTAAKAKEYHEKYGGEFTEWKNLTIAQANKLAEKYKIKEKAEQVIGMTSTAAQKFAEQAGGEAKEYVGKTMAQARKLAKKYKVKEKAGQAIDTIKDQAKKVSERAGEAKGWFGREWEAMKKYNAPLKKTGEFIEVGKGNFLELYRQGAGAVKEFYETASPEKKAWIRQNAERLLISGQITADELKKMGISLKDATIKAADKVGDTVVSSAVSTTQHISTAVNQMGGGGGGANNKMMQEESMNEITMGKLH